MRASWVALALAAVFIVYFVRRVALALADRERELQETRAQADRREKLASLATLAAGAAHELSTPLSTITVVAKELQRDLTARSATEVARDLKLIREQVARCREILDRMAGHAGEHVGEPLRGPDGRRVGGGGARRAAGPGAGGAGKRAPGVDGRHAGRPAAGAGRRAARPAQERPAGLRRRTRRWRCASSRRERAGPRHRHRPGRGMPPEVLARVGEPFFTTKVPGEGMGLGLFLTRALAEQLGGEFHITSRPRSTGPRHVIELPAATAGERSAA